MTHRLPLAILFCCSMALPVLAQPDQNREPLFVSDFSTGLQAWKLMDDGWKIKTSGSGENEFRVLSLHRKKSNYRPPHRSPLHIALIKDRDFESFELNAKVLSTHKDYNHRDVCFFFGYQGPDRFYYVHLGKKMDPHANQIFIVNQKDRTKISTTTSKGTQWDDQWHDVRIRRSVASGKIEVYFDDMSRPVMTATDKTFGKGKVGVGSFDDIADFRSIEIRDWKKNEKQNRGQ